MLVCTASSLLMILICANDALLCAHLHEIELGSKSQGQQPVDEQTNDKIRRSNAIYFQQTRLYQGETPLKSAKIMFPPSAYANMTDESTKLRASELLRRAFAQSTKNKIPLLFSNLPRVLRDDLYELVYAHVQKYPRRMLSREANHLLVMLEELKKLSRKINNELESPEWYEQAYEMSETYLNLLKQLPRMIPIEMGKRIVNQMIALKRASEKMKETAPSGKVPNFFQNEDHQNSRGVLEPNQYKDLWCQKQRRASLHISSSPRNVTTEEDALFHLDSKKKGNSKRKMSGRIDKGEAYATERGSKKARENDARAQNSRQSAESEKGSFLCTETHDAFAKKSLSTKRGNLPSSSSSKDAKKTSKEVAGSALNMLADSSGSNRESTDSANVEGSKPPAITSNEPISVGIWIHSGGMAKTTNSKTLAFALANRGFNVLLVDLDDQCDLTQELFNKEIEEEHDSLASKMVSAPQPDGQYHPQALYASLHPLVFCYERDFKPLQPKRYQDVSDGIGSIGVVLGHRKTGSLSFKIAQAMKDPYNAVSKKIFGAPRAALVECARRKGAHFIVVDFAPSTSILQRMMLMQMDYLLMPVVPGLKAYNALCTSTDAIHNADGDIMPETSDEEKNLGAYKSMFDLHNWIQEHQAKTSTESKYKIPSKVAKFLGITLNKFSITRGDAKGKYCQGVLTDAVKSKIMSSWSDKLFTAACESAENLREHDDRLSFPLAVYMRLGITPLLSRTPEFPSEHQNAQCVQEGSVYAFTGLKSAKREKHRRNADQFAYNVLTLLHEDGKLNAPPRNFFGDPKYLRGGKTPTILRNGKPFLAMPMRKPLSPA